MKNLYRLEAEKIAGTHTPAPAVPEPLAGAIAGRMTRPAGRSAAREVFASPRLMGMAIRLIAQATSGTDVRFDKVAALQQAIAAGTYSVAAADVADRLMAEEGW